MKTRTLVGAALALGIFLNLTFLVAALAGPPAGGPAPPSSPPYRISGPFSSGNLSVFLVHGQDQLKGTEILTLQEALAQKLVVVRETGNVNQLSIRNLSDKLVFVQSGDIVKGGRQDRTMQYDLILQPGSGEVPLASFCVESGRWSQRGSESGAVFGSAYGALATKSLKLAAKSRGEQSAVWGAVEEAQANLKRALKESVNNPASPSSLQLTLENSRVKETTQQYVDQLAKVVAGKNDAIGYAFAINGKINSADIYASHALFMKFWPKLLQSSAVEAIAERDGNPNGASLPPPSPGAVRACLQQPRAAKESTQSVARSTKLETRDSKDAVDFLTRDTEANVVLHRNLIAK